MKIDKAEVIRYMGFRKQYVPKHILPLIDRCAKECEDFAKPKVIYRTFDIAHISYGSVTFCGADIIFPGKSIVKHLKGAVSCVFLAATLGLDVDAQLNVLQHVDITSAVVFDACANAAIESVCDEAQQEIQSKLPSGLSLNSRFSPGYGDFSLDVQPKFLACLDAEKEIGLHCSQSKLLMPRKSVTAAIGVFPEESEARYVNRCDKCDRRETCAYSRAGKTARAK